MRLSASDCNRPESKSADSNSLAVTLVVVFQSTEPILGVFLSKLMIIMMAIIIYEIENKNVID